MTAARTTARAARPGGPIDPRLLAYARATRRYLVASVVLGVCTALLVVAQAWLIAAAVAGAFVRHEDLGGLRFVLVALLGVVAARALVAFVGERAAARASASAKSDLRLALAAKVASLGPSGLEHERKGKLTVLVTTGIDALDSYFSRYLPQLFLAVIVPITVIAVVAGFDWISAAIIAVTIPLIPLFMALVGASTKARTDRQVSILQRLAGHFLDLVAGLPTLKVFGRAKVQANAIREITDRYRRATMATLKVAFLSSLSLELLATVSVALVAVAVGLRLLGGTLGLETALFVLVLAPEAYLPLRQLGTHYHASSEGLRAAEEVFEVLERPDVRPVGTAAAPDPASAALSVDGLVVRYPGRRHPALAGVSLRVEPGEVLAVTGPSGCGKSTLLGAVLGFVASDAGTIEVGQVDLAGVDPDAWRAHLAWLPQRPHLFAASIGDNVRLGRPDASLQQVWSAVCAAGLDPVVDRLPDGLDTPLGERGAGLSAGERQRVALARAFLRDAPLVLLDEPTANLDGETEQSVLAALARLLEGRTAVVVAHRPSLLTLADRVLELALPTG